MSFVNRTGPLGLLAVAAVIGLAGVTLGDKGDRVEAQGDARELLRLRQAPVVAAQIGVAQAGHRRRHGRYAADLRRLLPLSQRSGLLRGHAAVTHARMGGYVASADGFSLTVNEEDRTVDATCTAPPEAGCHRGRWDPRRQAGVGAADLLP